MRRSSPTPTCAIRSATWTMRPGRTGRSSLRGQRASTATAVPQILRHLRPRRRAAARALVHLAAQRCRLFAARPRRALRELLLRRLRQQLRRPPATRSGIASTYSFPGAELNEIGGRNFVKSTIEWNLPPWRFRRAGTPGFYATWMRPAVFVDGLATNLDAPSCAARRHRRRRTARLPLARSRRSI